MWKRWLVVANMFFWVQVALIPTASAEEIVLEGALSLAHRGTVTGTEAFKLTGFERGFRLISRGRMSIREGEVTWVTRALYSPELYPLEYELEKRTPSAVIRIICSDTTGQGFSVEIYRNGTSRGSTLLRGQNPALLDEDVVSHYVILALRLWIYGGGEFTALVPQARAAMPLRAELEGLSALHAPWGDEVAQRWRLTLAGEEVLLYEHAGEFLWAAVPGAGLSAWRSDLFHSLPRPYRIQVKMSLPSGAKEEKVCFDSESIAGTLLLPTAGSGPFPAVLFIPGTGEVNRDGSAPGKPAAIFRELAYSLAQEGFASLRYDKRGVGESDGDLSSASLSDLRSDAGKALSWLVSRPEVNGVFVVGHSEGALHALTLAGEARVVGLALLGVPARPLEEVLPWQLETALRAAGAPEERISRELKKLRGFINFVRKGSGDWDDYTPDELRTELPGYSPEELEGMRKTSLRWWREALAFDPVAAVRKVEVPLLAVNGGADIRVPPEDVFRLAEAAREAGNPDAQGIVIPVMNHWLRFQPGRPLPERLIGPLDPRAIQTILDWLYGHSGR